MQQLDYFMDYCASYPNTEIQCYSSDMKPQIFSNSSYRLCPQVKSQMIGVFDLGKIMVSSEMVQSM